MAEHARNVAQVTLHSRMAYMTEPGVLGILVGDDGRLTIVDYSEPCIRTVAVFAPGQWLSAFIRSST